MDLDWESRLAAFDYLNRLRSLRGTVSAAEMKAGVEVRGERIPLFNEPVGIWRPRQLGRDGAALSITTAPPKPGRPAPYADQVASDSSRFEYRYQRKGPDNWMNRSLRRAMELQRPVIYFFGVGPRLYEAVYPLYVAEDNVAEGIFFLQPDANAALALGLGGPETEIQRAYATREIKVRLHQRQFREAVMRAYRTTCSVCQIRHDPLLDAAHILADKDERGRPEVPNGIALCKIHHAAFDTHILGIDEAHLIHIRTDILLERDGPMLLHGLQNMDGERIVTPRNAHLKPNKEYLAERFERFKAA